MTLIVGDSLAEETAKGERGNKRTAGVWGGGGRGIDRRSRGVEECSRHAAGVPGYGCKQLQFGGRL
jgi:hypothetical protein